MSIKDIIEEMNRNYYGVGPSTLGKIEEGIIDLKFRSMKLDNKNINDINSELDSFGANLYSNPNMFPDRDHSDIKNVENYFNVRRHEYLNNLEFDNNRTMTM